MHSTIHLFIFPKFGEKQTYAIKVVSIKEYINNSPSRKVREDSIIHPNSNVGYFKQLNDQNLPEFRTDGSVSSEFLCMTFRCARSRRFK